MNRDYYQPANNYERNFLMVKKFGGKFSVFCISLLLFGSVLCSGYLAISDEHFFEISILKVVTSKFNVELNLENYETFWFVLSVLISAFVIYSLLYVFFTSKNSSFQSSPDLGYSLLHKYSVLFLIMSTLVFIVMVITTAVFIFGDIERFESLGKMFKLTVNELSAFKATFAILFVLCDAFLFFVIWYAQSQTEFIKSIRQSLVESIPKNKGARTYGVFSMIFAVAMLTVAAFCTFMYYCYRDAFSGFGINIDDTYVFISLAFSYIRGLVPLFISISAFSYSSMVEQINAYGTLYNDYTVLGTASDPNMTDRRVVR